MAEKGKVRLQVIKALVELDRLKYKYEPVSEAEVKMKCPVHKEGKEESPSCFLNVEKNLWYCQSASCVAKGDIVSLLAFITQTNRQTIIVDLSTRYQISDKKTLNPELIEKYHKKIWEAGPLLKSLRDRGVTDDLIRKARLGYFNGRITIPIYDKERRIVNCRRYLPGAPGPEKMKNTPGYGKNNIYQVEQLHYGTVWVNGGEIKALVVGGLLNKHGIGSVSATAGEGNWEESLSILFKDKRVYICLDVDKGGLVARSIIAAHIFNYAASVKVIELPLDKKKYPKGDINDYIATEGATDQDLLKLMTEAKEWFPPELKEEKDDLDPIEVNLGDATNAEHVAKKIRMNAVISTMDTTPYIIPREVNVQCSKDQPNCALCIIKAKEPDPETGFMKVKIRSTSPGILGMINSAKKYQRGSIMEALRIPPCKVVEFKTVNHYNITDVRLNPELNIGNESSKNVSQPAYCVGTEIEMNTPYIMTGRVYPHPKSQQAILLMNGMKETKDSLSSFKPTEEEFKQLKTFQPAEQTADGLERKLEEIYEDLETNITRIFYRRYLHVAMDLCYHSPLMFNFDDQEIKGWINLLVLGDTSQGKSETAIRLSQHYGLGERTECKNASLAGLLGGLNQIGNRWFVSWGLIPTHDRRLVVLEEIKGADPEIIAKLTDMRSSGIAEIPKIEKKRAYARTRLIFISNPRSNRPISAYNYGVEAVQELMSGLEDIRRLDLAVIVSQDQIDIEKINQITRSRPQIPHVYTGALCRSLILWTWTRTASNIIFEDDAMNFILDKATELSKTFTDTIPLIDRGTTRHKIARLSAAVAARTYSTENDEDIIVKKFHVEFICNFIDSMYSNKIFGYRAYSEAQSKAYKLGDANAISRRIRSSRYPRDLVDALLYSDEMVLNDFIDWTGADKDTAQQLLSLLVRKHAIYRLKRAYVKTPEFISLLKEMKKEGIEQVAQAETGEEF